MRTETVNKRVKRVIDNGKGKLFARLAWNGLLPNNCMECGAKITGLSQQVGKHFKDKKVVCLKCAKEYGK